MADNVTANPGVGGAVFATDDIGGVQYPRHKMIIGADGVNDGDVSAANPLPVTGTVGVSGSIAVTGPLTDTQLRASAVPISAPSLPLPTGAATETTAAAISAKLPTLATTVPHNDEPAIPVRPVGQYIFNVSFSEVGASVISPQFTTPIVGTGVGYSQAAGALAITAGTTTNQEFLTRSVESWEGSMRMRVSTVLSQRNTNNNFLVMLADLIGEGLAVTINSATSITVALAGHTFTSQSVGQFMYVGGIVGAAGIPGRYAIASVVAGVSINLTVSGWPASGSCTATLFGHSFAKVHFTGTTATSALVTTQRRGWAEADTTATINTTASPGTIVHMELTGRECFWHDTLRASGTAPTVTQRAFRYENLPDDNQHLHLFIWSYNNTSAPTATTWTISFCAVEKYANTPVYIQGARAVGAANPIPVQTQGTVPVSLATNTPVLAAGTNLAADVGVQYRANATGAATLTNINCPATPAAQQLKSGAGRLVGLNLFNTSGSTRWLKIFNLASASVTPGTTAALTEIGIPAGGRLEFRQEGGAAFSTGITVMITGGAGLTNNTAVTLADVTGFGLHA